MPIYRLLPKRGFKNINRVEYSPINLSTLQKLADKTGQKEITLELMKANGLISLKDKIKILGNGELTSILTVTAHAFSKSAQEAIEKTGGKCISLMQTLVAVEPKAVEEAPVVETSVTEEPKNKVQEVVEEKLTPETSVEEIIEKQEN
jgi:ribosomal protein L18E